MPFTPTLSSQAFFGSKCMKVPVYGRNSSESIDSHFPIRYYNSNVTLLLLIESYFVGFVAESESGRFMNAVPGNSLTLLLKRALS